MNIDFDIECPSSASLSLLSPAGNVIREEETFLEEEERVHQSQFLREKDANFFSPH